MALGTYAIQYQPLPFSIQKDVIQRASEASEADSQSCSIEISDIYIYVGMYAYVKKFRPRF